MLENGPQVLSTGGGAFMNAQTREAIAGHGVSVWLKAELDLLMERVSKKQNRPLLKSADPRAVLERLMGERYPVYATSDVTVPTRDDRKEVIAAEVLDALCRHFGIDEIAATGEVRIVSADQPVTVEVGLGDRAYDILIGSGLLSRAGAEISRRLPGTRAAVVTDENVAAAHLDTLKAGLEKGGIQPAVITMPPGEKTKSFAHLEEVVDGVLAARLERGDVVIALGGGVIGDLTGFAAGIVRRGMNFVQIPTSLLAQVDSSVGGKTGINSPRGKNLVGVFHQPKLVLADTEVLDTLPIREFRAGYAELAKYGLIDRPEFFAWLEANWKQGVRRRAGAERGDCRSLPRQGRCRRPRRVRDRRPRAAQSRPHIRPCARSRHAV